MYTNKKRPKREKGKGPGKVTPTTRKKKEREAKRGQFNPKTSAKRTNGGGRGSACCKEKRGDPTAMTRGSLNGIFDKPSTKTKGKEMES